MKIRKPIGLVLCAGFLLVSINGYTDSPACKEGQSYQTSIGAKFRCVNLPKFGTAWEAPDGAHWGVSLGLFTNVGTESNGVIIDSKASMACIAVGGILPTVADFQSLRSYFDTEVYEDVMYLSKKGLYDWNALFLDRNRADYWTSTPIDKKYAHTFSSDGSIFDWDRRFDWAVRCVSR